MNYNMNGWDFGYIHFHDWNEIIYISSNTCVFDTSCEIHIFNSLPGFRKNKELKKWDGTTCRQWNMGRVQSIGNFELCLPSGLYLKLYHFCLITTITKNIILVSRWGKSGFNYQFVDDYINSFLNGVFFFAIRAINGIYELNIDDYIYYICSQKLEIN